MSSEIQMNSSSLQSLLIILVIICAISYAYLEFRKINSRLEILENKESRTEQMFLELKESLQKDNFKSSLMGANNENEIPVNDEDFDDKYDEGIPETSNSAENEAVNEEDIQMDSISQTEEIQEIQEQQPIQEIQDQQPIQEEVYEQPTVMSFSFLSTMNHVETPSNENNIEDITEEKEEVINETADLVEDDSETKIIKTDKYDNCTVKELKDILTEKNLPTSGNKTKLIQRIIENTE